MQLVEQRAPALAPGLELLGELRDSGYADAPRLVRRADGQTVQVTPLLYQLLEEIDGERHYDALAEALSQRCGKTCAPDDVRMLVEEKLAPLGLLAAADGSAPAVQKQIPLLALRWKAVVSNPDVTRRITAPFAFLFEPVVAVPVLAAFAVTVYWVLFREGLAAATRQAFDSPGLLLGAFVLALVSAGWHEFGHAAACRYAGATPGAMGVGLYIVFPAFYTDVDDAQRLPRRGRLIVDLGGLHFNAVAAVAMMGAWLATGLDAILLVVATQLLLMLRQLAPIIRADGYHILSDLVGVPDLFQHIKPTLAGLLPTNWGRPQPLRPAARWTVRAWVLIVVPLLVWLVLGAILLLPRMIATAWVGLRQQGRTISAGFGDGGVLAVGAGMLQTVALVLPVIAGTYMLVRVVKKAGGGMWARTEGRPIARSALVLVTVVGLAFALVAWWPAGQYQPVRADERGTITGLFDLASADSARAPVDTDGASAGDGADDAVGIDGVTPTTGYALVPRDDDAPALLLVRDGDGMQAIVTDGPDSGLSFPFAMPAAPGEGDNQALAVNTRDWSFVYDVAVALVWVKDGGVAANRNEAWALASCTACTTVAVAFQVVLVIGETEAVAPINVAVAANGGCISCETTALAVQLTVTLAEMPSEELQAKIEAAMARLDDVESSADPVAEIEAVKTEIVTLLADEGLIDEDDAALLLSEDSSTASTSTTVADGSEASDGSSTSSSSTSSSTTSTTVRSTTTTTATTASDGGDSSTTATSAP